MATVTVSPIRLAVDHDGAACLEMAWSLSRQLSNGYTHRVSAMPLDGSFDDYLADHRTARKRAAHSARLGYRFAEIDRHAFEDDIYAINTSAPARQGRPMSQGYLQAVSFGANPKYCDLHHVYTYGVLSGERLVAYLWLYRSGELAMVSSILGHADHLTDDIMYLLVTEAVRAQIRFGGTLFYNLHSSGQDGLRYFKERLGLTATEVEWTL